MHGSVDVVGALDVAVLTAAMNNVCPGRGEERLRMGDARQWFKAERGLGVIAGRQSEEQTLRPTSRAAGATRHSNRPPPLSTRSPATSCAAPRRLPSFLFGSPKYRRRAYNLVERNELPIFRIGVSIRACKSVLLQWIERPRCVRSNRLDLRRGSPSTQYSSQPCSSRFFSSVKGE
jgi:hypothetical protein